MYRSPKIRQCFAAVAIVTALTTMSITASAGPEESDERRMQAQSLFDQGQKLADSDPKGALAAFRLSYDIRPDFHALYNIARICVRLNDHPCARQAYEQYLKDGGNEIPAKRRKDAETELGVILKGNTSLMIKSSVTGAYVKVDGVVVGRTPLDKPIPVSAGSHKVVLVADGNVTEKSVHVASGAASSVDFEPKFEPKKEEAPLPVPVAPAPAPAPEAVESAPEPQAPHPADTTPKRAGVPVVPWIITGAFAAGAVVTGALTVNENSNYNAMRDDFPIRRDDLDAAHARGKNLLFLTGTLGAAALVSGGIATYLTLSRGSAPADKTVGIAIGPTSVAITGRLP